MKTVGFSNFWKNFDTADNLFVELLEAHYGEISILDSRSTALDLEISSIFTPKMRHLRKKISALVKSTSQSFENEKDFYRSTVTLARKSPASRSVWYSGENVRPPIDPRYDGFLSFDQDDYYGKNAYLPLWQMHFRENASIYRSPQLGSIFQVEEFISGRALEKVPKKFVCAFINNLDPRRMRAIESLQRYGEVDIYGRKFGKYIEDKTSVASEYRYVLAFENDFYPGYVTEKIFDAYACKSIPLYWGSLGREKAINAGSFIDASNFENFEALASHVAKISEDAWQEIYEQPLLSLLPDFSDISRVLIGE